MATTEDDLKAINEELVQTGFIKKNIPIRKLKIIANLYTLFHQMALIYTLAKIIFKMNILLFKVATGNDWWFHSKSFPGSHVIVKCNNQELPDNTF